MGRAVWFLQHNEGVYESNLSHTRAYGGRYIRSRMQQAVFREPQWSPCMYQMLIRRLIGCSKRNMSSICACVPLLICSLPGCAAKFSGMRGSGEMQLPVPGLTSRGAPGLAGTDGQVPLPHRGNMGHFPRFLGEASGSAPPKTVGTRLLTVRRLQCCWLASDGGDGAYVGPDFRDLSVTYAYLRVCQH